MSSNPIQYVTLVSGGGTPVRIADQKGSPYPTTGYGALVFNINPTIEGGLIVNGDIVFTGDLQGPYNSPLTTQGDLYYYGPTGNTRLPVGAAGTTLTSDGNNAYWRVGGASPGGTAGGDLDGTYPNPTIKLDVGLQGDPTRIAVVPVGANNQTLATTKFVKDQGYLTTATAGTTYLPLTGGTLAGPGTLVGTTATFTGAEKVMSATAIPAGGTAGAGYLFSSTANFGMIFGSGVPTAAMARGSIYLRSDGGGPYVNTDGATTWAVMGGGGGGASLTISDTPPGSPTAGMMWWNSVLGTLMIYYQDANSSQWVPATPTVSGAGTFLPLTGGTLTGPLIGTTAAFTGAITAPQLTSPAATNLLVNAPSGQLIAFRNNNANIAFLSANAFYPAGNGTTDLGGGGNQWASFYGVAGNFSGALTGTTASFTSTNLGAVAGNTTKPLTVNTNDGNVERVDLYWQRATAGADWTTAQTKLQRFVDNSPLGYVFWQSGEIGLTWDGFPRSLAVASNGAVIFANGAANINSVGTFSGTTATFSGVVTAANIGTVLNNSLGTNVALNNAANYFDGPSVAQGATGTWFATGTVTVSSGAAATIMAKLWDGTNVIASAQGKNNNNGDRVALNLSGYRASPAGNLRISVKSSDTSSSLNFNDTGNSKDCTISVWRVS